MGQMNFDLLCGRGVVLAVVAGLALPCAPLSGEPPAADAAPAAASGAEVSLERLSEESYEDLLKAWGETADSDATPLENLALPLESHPNGKVKVLLRADSALIPAEGLLRGRGLVVEIYDDQGRLECILIADNCIFDRQTQRGYCEGPVRIERKGVRLTGNGMVWMVKEQSAKILSDVKVLSNRFIRDMKGLL